MQTHHKASEASSEADISDTREKPGRSEPAYPVLLLRNGVRELRV